MEVIYPRCAGLDVHKKTVVACCIHTQNNGHKEQETRTFGTTTRELLALLGWLQQWGCTHVALESTGVYWQPVYYLLEGHLELLLVNAQHTKAVRGRKTDVRDAEWLADLLRHGLLKASFVPPPGQRDLRELTRGRSQLVEERAAVVNRLQKVLEGANLKLGDVVTDVMGLSARRILAALVAGETDPEQLAELARGKLRAKRAALAAALDGRVREHHRFLLTQHLTHLEFLEAQIACFDQQVEQQLALLSGEAGPGATGGGATGGSAAGTEGGPGAPPVTPVPEEPPAPAVRRHPALPPEEPLSFQRALMLLATIPGVGRRSAEVILAEIGPDMRRFLSAGSLAKWVGVAPSNRQSGGKQGSGRITGGNPVARQALIQVAHGASVTKDSYPRALYHRLAPRRGRKRALVAVARSVLVVIYHVLLWQEPYRELGGNYFDERQRESVTNRLVQRLTKLGYEVQLQPYARAA
jgi:transposase